MRDSIAIYCTKRPRSCFLRLRISLKYRKMLTRCTSERRIKIRFPSLTRWVIKKAQLQNVRFGLVFYAADALDRRVLLLQFGQFGFQLFVSL